MIESQILSVDTGARKVTVSHGFEQHSHVLEYDHVVFALGCVTNFYGIPNLAESGFVAWWLWRTIYLLKLPRTEKKLRVALDWTLDVFFSKDLLTFSLG
jgi:NADH dehydrogenase FAD-containing subunit